MAHLGFAKIKDIERMTTREYQLRTEAYQIKRAEHYGDIALGAYWNQVFKSQKGSPKHPQPRYTKPEQVWDEQAQIDRIRSIYEPDYVSANDSKVNVAKLMAKRSEEFHRLKASGKIIPWKERRGKNGTKL